MFDLAIYFKHKTIFLFGMKIKPIQNCLQVKIKMNFWNIALCSRDTDIKESNQAAWHWLLAVSVLTDNTTRQKVITFVLVNFYLYWKHKHLLSHTQSNAKHTVSMQRSTNTILTLRLETTRVILGF